MISLQKFTASLAFATTMLASSAFAAPINGTIDIFAGTVPLNTTSLATATGAKATSSGKVADTSIGDFLAIGSTDSVTVNYKAFNWTPFVPVTSLWSFTDGSIVGSFDLTGLTIVDHTATLLDLTGTGMLHLTGFDDTMGTWSYQITTTNTTRPQTKFVFQSSNSVPPTPENSMTGILFGLGLIAVGGAARRFKAVQA